MPTQHVSYQAEFGIALHERGLNRASAGLRASQPDKFAFRTDIEIIPPSGADPGHILTLYAVADEPLAFNLYPVETTPTIQVDSFFVAANILFTLTDSALGAVTRIRIQVEAAGQVIRRDGQMVVRLAPKPDGSPWFDIVDIEGEHPESLIRLVQGAVDSGTEIANALHLATDDGATARAFRAIMDYLITIFLREGLVRVITEFPLPSLDGLVEMGPLGNLPGRDIFIRNDSLYLTIGESLTGDGDFPIGVDSADLRIGASEEGLQRIVDAMGNLPVPIDLGHDKTTIRIRSNDFHISSIHFNLRPGHEKFLGFVFFGGTLDLRIQFEVFGAWVRTPYLPLPIDASLSHFGGLFLPFLQVDNPDAEDGSVQLRIRPDQNFVEAWYLFVATNYRALFRDVFSEAIERVRDKLKRDKFCNIPVVGWVVCGVLDLFGDVLGWALGAVLDVFMSTWLTVIFNTIGRIVLQFLGDRDFRVFEIAQKKVFEMTGLRVRSGSVHQVADGREGELQLRLSFGEGGFPSPPPPVPTPADPEPVPFPPFPNPDPQTLPEYSPADFDPLLALAGSNWTDGASETYRVRITGEIDGVGEMNVRYERHGTHWRVVKSIRFAEMGIESNFVADYTEDRTRPVRCECVSRVGTDGGGRPIEARHIVDFHAAGKAAVSSSMPNDELRNLEITVMDTQYLEFEEIWFFRIAYCPLAEGMRGRFGRVEVSDPFTYRNWARQIPVEVVVNDGQINWPPDTVGSKPVWTVSSQDEEGYVRLNIDKGGGILTAKIVKAGNELTLTRLN